MFASIKNGQLAKRKYIIQKKKKICEAYLNVLWDEGFIIGYKNIDDTHLKIFLKYINDKPVITNLKTISRPGHRLYFSAKQIWKLDSTKTFIIFSTSKGIKSIVDCKKENLGGEPVLLVS